MYEFTKRDIDYIVRNYPAKRLPELAAEYGVSTTPIRRILVEAGVEIEGRGRPPVANAA